MARLFLSTLSLRRATPSSTVIVILRKNFYPRSPCGERRKITITVDEGTLISIHALLAESDYVIGQRIGIRIDISIHALLAESDVMHALKFASAVLFLSTLSLRRATIV